MYTEKIIVSLDGFPDSASALSFARKLKDFSVIFKGNDLFDLGGIALVAELKKYGRVFVDQKFHDIPQTVFHRTRRFAEAGADFITVHASGGSAMLEQAVAASAGTNAKIIAVTILTSLSEKDCSQIYHKTIAEMVEEFARTAFQAGVHGIVCSPQELSLLNNEPFNKLLKITPGIRPAGILSATDDQHRIATPREAFARGADYIVIGRPITQASDPKQALEEILKGI